MDAKSRFRSDRAQPSGREERGRCLLEFVAAQESAIARHGPTRAQPCISWPRP